MGTFAYSQPQANIAIKFLFFSVNAENRTVVVNRPPALETSAQRLVPDDHNRKLEA
jgi:hypothetical protein